MQSRQIPKEITIIIMGLIVVFISLRAGVKLLIEWQMKEKARKTQTQAQTPPDVQNDGMAANQGGNQNA
jgi:simple sugar transport system permease protein